MNESRRRHYSSLSPAPSQFSLPSHERVHNSIQSIGQPKQLDPAFPVAITPSAPFCIQSSIYIPAARHLRQRCATRHTDGNPRTLRQLDSPLPKVLFFDVFGTVVEWRDCVTRALMRAAESALLDPEKQLSVDVRVQAGAMTPEDWQAIAEEWRASYGQFTASFEPSSAFVSVDEHHYTYIHKLLQQRGLDDMLTDKERWDLALCWHRLEPWSDTVEGLRLLNRQFRTCTLSNGNVALLEDLRNYGSLPFTDMASAEHFGAYKPSPQVYQGAVKRFGLDPSECGMVAAHLYDLKAAKALGFMTIYIERPQEENLTAEQIAEARREGFVDQWFSLGCGGLVEVARRFGIPTETSS